MKIPPHIHHFFFYMPTPETLEFINTDTHTNTNKNKNMTFELLKVCRQANPTWIELRVMYVRSTVMDRHARWVIINQNCCIYKIELSSFFLFLYFVLSFIFFLQFSSYQSISFCFRWFRFISFPFR